MHRLGSWIVVSGAALSFGLIPACSDDDDDDDDIEFDAGAGGSDGTGGRTGTGGSAGSGGSAGDGGAGGSAGSGGSGGATEAGAGGAMADAGDAAPTLAMVRVVHAATGAADVDVYVADETTPIIEDLAYGEATDYLEVPPGSLELDVRVAGDAATVAPIYTTPAIELEAGSMYTAVAMGDITSMDDASEFRIAAFEENFGADAADTAQVRVVHAGFDAPTVGVDVGNDNPADPEIVDVERFAASDAAGVGVPSGDPAQVSIVANDERVTVFTTPELEENDDVFVIATGSLARLPREPEGFSLLVVLPDSTTVWVQQNPRIYALHAAVSPDNVDVYVGSIEIADNLQFGELFDIQVPPGSYTADFFPGQEGPTDRPAGSPSGSLTTPSVTAGNEYLAVIAGETTMNTFELINAQEAFDLDEAGALLRAVHASADAGTVGIGTVTTAGTLDMPVAFAALSYEEVTAAAGTAVPAGNVTLGVVEGTDTSPTVAEFDVTTTAGQRAFVVAGGDYSSIGTLTGFRLFIVDTAVSPWVVTNVPPN